MEHNVGRSSPRHCFLMEVFFFICAEVIQEVQQIEVYYIEVFGKILKQILQAEESPLIRRGETENISTSVWRRNGLFFTPTRAAANLSC